MATISQKTHDVCKSILESRGMDANQIMAFFAYYDGNPRTTSDMYVIQKATAWREVDIPNKNTPPSPQILEGCRLILKDRGLEEEFENFVDFYSTKKWWGRTAPVNPLKKALEWKAPSTYVSKKQNLLEGESVEAWKERIRKNEEEKQRKQVEYIKKRIEVLTEKKNLLEVRIIELQEVLKVKTVGVNSLPL